MRKQCFRALLAQDATFYDHPAHSSANLTARLSSDAPRVPICERFSQRVTPKQPDVNRSTHAPRALLVKHSLSYAALVLHSTMAGK